MRKKESYNFSVAIQVVLKHCSESLHLYSALLLVCKVVFSRSLKECGFISPYKNTLSVKVSRVIS